MKKSIAWIFCSLAFGSFAIAQDQEVSLKEIRSELEQPIKRENPAEALEILNVSYDATRELYEEYNKLFSSWWMQQTKQQVTVRQSHGGSGKQARAVIAGLDADVVTLALSYDINAIYSHTKWLPENWQERLPHDSTPYFSTIVFLVRKGNPKKIHDWNDLIRPDIKVITPNPKTSGGARWNYLGAWSYAIGKFHGNKQEAMVFMSKLYANVPILDAGARGSTTTFVKRGIGDVLLSWENEAFLAKEELGSDQFEIIYPSISVMAEPAATWVDGVVNKRDTQQVAKFYLKYLYSLEGQKLIARNFFRPIDKGVFAEYAFRYPAIKMKTIQDFGGWTEAQKVHFGDDGIFDKIYLMKEENQ